MPGQAGGIRNLQGNALEEALATPCSIQWQLRYQHALDHSNGTWTAPMTWLLAPKNSTMTKCRNADTTGKRLSAGDIQQKQKKTKQNKKRRKNTEKEKEKKKKEKKMKTKH